MQLINHLKASDHAPLPSSSVRVGERLLELGLITADQLHIALHEQKIDRLLLGTLLVNTWLSR